MRTLAQMVVATPAVLGLAAVAAWASGYALAASPETVLAAAIGGVAVSLAGGVVGVALVRARQPAVEPRPKAYVHVVRAGGIRTGHPWFPFLFPNRVKVEYLLRAELHVQGEVHARVEQTVRHSLHRHRDADLLQRVLLDVGQYGEAHRQRWARELPEHDVVLALPDAAALSSDLPRLG